MTQIQEQEIEAAVLLALKQEGPSAMDELVRDLQDYSWNQIFSAVDRLSRQGRLTLHRASRFGYLVALASASEAEVMNSAA